MNHRRSRREIEMSFDLPYLKLKKTREDPPPLSPSEIAALADKHKQNIAQGEEHYDELKHSTKRN